MDTGPQVPQDVLDAAALAEEGVDDGGALGHQRGLAEEGDDGEDAVEALKLGVGLGAEGDALAQLRQDGQVQDDGAGQQRVLRAARVSHPPPGRCHHPPGTPRSPSPRTSHVLWMTMVLVPPIMISDVYSSSARLLSPT